MNIKFVLISGILCGAIVGGIASIIELFFMENIIEAGWFTDTNDFWTHALQIYALLMIPVLLIGIIYKTPERAELLGEVALFSGKALIDVACLVGAGYLIFLGWHLASTVFN